MIPGYDEWKTTPPDEPEGETVKENLSGPGWEALDSDIFVSEEDAFDYALERVKQGSPEEKKEFIMWFYSGGWIKEDQKWNLGKKMT